MQDALVLANHLYDIKPTTFEDIQAALKGQIPQESRTYL
jgi:hypothetical protein